MKFIRTMTGDISPEELGFTYSHEHIVCIPPYWEQKGEFDLLLDDPQKSEEEIKAAKEAGVNAVVDATAIDYGRQPQIVHDISIHTGMYIIGTAGFNKSFLWEAQIPGEKRSFKEWIEGAKIEELTDFAVGEIEKGMQKKRTFFGNRWGAATGHGAGFWREEQRAEADGGGVIGGGRNHHS